MLRGTTNAQPPPLTTRTAFVLPPQCSLPQTGDGMALMLSQLQNRISAFRPVQTGTGNNHNMLLHPAIVQQQHQQQHQHQQQQRFIPSNASILIGNDPGAALQSQFGPTTNLQIPVQQTQNGYNNIQNTSVHPQQTVSSAMAVPSIVVSRVAQPQSVAGSVESATADTKQSANFIADPFSVEKYLDVGAASDSNTDKATNSPDSSISPRDQATFEGNTVLCQVCGDKASGFHYGVHACEGCKGFFRRSIQQKIQYRPCTKNQQCSVLRINRNRCQYCRLKKCIAVGMSRDAVRFGRVPKKEKEKIRLEMQRANCRSQVESLSAEIDNEDKLLTAIVAAHMHTNEFTRDKLMPFLSHFQALGLAGAQSSPVACPLNPRPLGGITSNEHDLSERYSPAIRGVVDFAKCIPGFHVLSQSDQVTLLKAGMFEILLLRLSVLFDGQSKSMLLLDGSVYRRELCPAATTDARSHGRFLVDSLFDFVDRFNTLRLNDIDTALYCACVLVTPDRPGLRNGELVERMQQRIRSCLRRTLALHHPDRPDLFAQLIARLADLRTLNTLHQEKLLSFKVHDQQLQAFKPNDLSPSASSGRTRSPLSDHSHSDDAACKRGRPSPSSLSPQATSTGGSLDLARRLQLSPSKPINTNNNNTLLPPQQQQHQQQLWPSREAASFDSGKGTLSAKASSGSDTDSEHSHSPKHMAALKQALQAPPCVLPRCPVPQPPAAQGTRSLMQKGAGAGSGSLREKHQMVALLLEKKPSVLPHNVLVNYQDAIDLSSTASGPTSARNMQQAHASNSPKRRLIVEANDEPLNLSMKRVAKTEVR